MPILQTTLKMTWTDVDYTRPTIHIVIPLSRSCGGMLVSTWLSVCLSVCQSVRPSICLSVCLFVRLSFCLSVALILCLFVCLKVVSARLLLFLLTDDTSNMCWPLSERTLIDVGLKWKRSRSKFDWVFFRFRNITPFLLAYNKNTSQICWPLPGENLFLCRLRSIATHRDHFVRRPGCLSVCPSVCHSFRYTFQSYVSQANTHSPECCHYFLFLFRAGSMNQW